ncbi:MAG: hypothetical protein QM636_08690 [Rhizobium sp.]
MYTLEAALVHQWCHKAMSEEEFMRSADLGRVFRRTMAGFAAFAVLLLCLDGAASINRPQVAAVDQMRLMPEAKEAPN